MPMHCHLVSVVLGTVIPTSLCHFGEFFKVMGYCLLINIHEIIVLPFSVCIHCEPKRTKSSKKQHQLHVLAALVSILAHTVHEGKTRVDLHELRRQFSSPENALCRVYQHLWQVQSVFQGGSKQSGVYMPLLVSVSPKINLWFHTNKPLPHQ